MRVLLVDDDAGLRALLRTTLGVLDLAVVEAETAVEAERSIAEERPAAIVLDVALPGESGLSLCKRLKRSASTRDIPVVLLTGADASSNDGADAGADAYLRKPFRPLELLAVLERVLGGTYGVPFRVQTDADPDEQLLLYARDLRHMLDLERAQRLVVQAAYRQTVSALASALESKDTGTRAHSQRVQRYAVELTRAVAPDLLDDPSTEYGFLLHDVGKIGIPDDVLLKPRALSAPELSLMQTHPVLGEQMLTKVEFLHGEGLRVVRSHHERWDGAGYPDGLQRDEIPIGARVFAVADALDAITTTRPYRPARPWRSARREIASCSGTQFDPDVVEAFFDCSPQLLDIRRELALA